MFNVAEFSGWVSKLMDKGDVTDSYVDVHLGKARLARTRVIDNDLNPKFNENYRVEVCHFANELTFDIKDKDHAYSELIGNVKIATATLLNGDPVEGWFNITKRSGRSKGQIKLKVVYKSKGWFLFTFIEALCQSQPDTEVLHIHFPASFQPIWRTLIMWSRATFKCTKIAV